MLHFATLALSNPKRPEIPPVVVRAMVTSEPFRLAIDAALAQTLALDKITDHEVKEAGDNLTYFMPVAGPLCVNYNGKEIFTGALVGPGGVVIGEMLARELMMQRNHVAMKEENVMMPPPVFAASTLPRDMPGPASRIMIAENSVPLPVCQDICEYAATQPRVRAGVLDTDVDIKGQEKSIIDPKQRDTYLVNIDEDMTKKLAQLFHSIMINYIQPFYGVDVEWWEYPQLLSYKDGGRYDPHVDADRWVSDGQGRGHWEPYLDRDISMLFYINDTFTGGKLNFPDQHIKVQPKPGLVVAFPSSSKYRHGAEPTLSGERLALVTWIAVKGRQRLRSERPTNVIFMDQFKKQ